jgi:hypothetical protein
MAMARNTMDIPISGILAKRSIRAMGLTPKTDVNFWWIE